MATNDFLPIAVGGSANVVTQSALAADTALRNNGFQAGVAPSAKFNKALRQSTIMAAVLGQFIADESGSNSVDDGTTATLLSNLKAGINSMISALASTAITAAGDPTFANSSTSPASTGWIRGAMSSIAVAAGFSLSLSTNGHIKLPGWLGGLIFKWVVGATDPADATEITQNLTYATAFPNASLAEWASTRLASASSTSDQFYQTFGPSTSGCQVQRQVAGTSSGNRATTPILFAIGY